MPFRIPEQATQHGFITTGLGAHSSRTIMLAELRLLLSTTPPSSSFEDYRQAIQVENVLLKQTESTRKESVRRLRELYGLSPDWIIFRALRDLWDAAGEGQPQLALLAALTRDPVLRATADAIFPAAPGDIVTPQAISIAAQHRFPDLNETTLANIGRHAASSWHQSGHLSRHTPKIRTLIQCHPSSVTYALFLGHLCGERGEGLFQTGWARLLDAPLHTLHNQAQAASRNGWLEYRRSGSITDISFRYLQREKGS